MSLQSDVYLGRSLFRQTHTKMKTGNRYFGHAAVIGILSLVCGCWAQAGTVEWTGQAGSSWSIPNSWSPAYVPYYFDQIFIGQNGGACEIGGLTSLQIDYGGSINVVGGTLNWTNSAASVLFQSERSSGTLAITSGG